MGNTDTKYIANENSDKLVTQEHDTRYFGH